MHQTRPYIGLAAAGQTGFPVSDPIAHARLGRAQVDARKVVAPATLAVKRFVMRDWCLAVGKRIAEAVASNQQLSKQHEDIRVETLDTPEVMGAVARLSELLIHRSMMVAVATRGPRIQDVDDYYRAREA